MRLQIQKINKYSVLFLLLIIFIFIEIIVISPTLLEKSNDEESFHTDNHATTDSSKGNLVKNEVEQKMRGVHLVESRDNENGWELYANEAAGTSDSKWIVKKVKIQFFNDNKTNYVVTGDIGEIDGSSKDMVIHGHVTTTSSNGYLFKTDTLRYSSKQKTMTSPDIVVMEGPSDKNGRGFRLKGERLLVDISANTMSILDKIVATKIINDKNFRLTATRADFSNKNQEAVFSGYVKMTLGALKLQSPLASFYYSEASDALIKVLLQRGVVFTQDDRKGICNELEIDLLEDKMTMRGNPKVQQGADEIKGYEIVFIDGGKKVRINRR